MVEIKSNINVSRNVSNAAFRFVNTASQGEAGLAGAQLQESGEVTEEAGLRMTKLELEMRGEANQLRVDDAINQAREEAIRLQHDPDEGYNNLKGYDAMERPDGVPLTEEYSAKLEDHMNLIADALGNDDQKALFANQSKNLIAGFRETTLKYEGQEFQSYSKSVRRGTIDNRTQEIALNYNNPEVVKDALISIEASAEDLGRQEGLAASERQSVARKAMSKGHMVVIETAMQNEDTIYADDYFKKNAKNMHPDDILRVNGVLGEQLDTKLATEVVDQVMDDESDNLATSDSSRAFNIALNTESGGKQFGGAGSVAGPDEPTTSPAGAIGIAQIMPATGPEAAKLAGVEWDEERFKKDPEYNRALGKAYFEDQLRKFDGSLAKSYAAYNAGPGATRRAVEEAGPGGDWLSLLPKETQDYVTKNRDAYLKGKGSNKRPTLLQVQDKVKEQIGTDSPRRLKVALAEAERQYNVQTKAIEAEKDANTANAMRELIQNGGDYKALSSQVRSSIHPTEVGSVIDFAKKIAKGDDSTNNVLYNQYTEHPELLANMDSNQFLKLKGHFNQADWEHFAKIRADILNGNQTEGQNPGSLNSAAIKADLDNRFLELGITIKDDPEQIGAIRKFVNNAVIASQQANGKKMNDAETAHFIDKLFTKRSTFNSIGWFGLDVGDQNISVLSATSNEIPKDIQKQIKAAFKKEGIKPTDAEILEAYWRQVFYENKSKDEGSF